MSISLPQPDNFQTLKASPTPQDMEDHSTGQRGQPREGARAPPPCQAFPRRHHPVREAGPLYPNPLQKKGPGTLEALKAKEPTVSPKEEGGPPGAAEHKQPPSASLPGLVRFINNDGVHSTARLVRGTMVAAAARIGVEASREATMEDEEEPEGEEESGGAGSGQGLVEDKRFLCVACGKHFKRAWELFSHEVVHNSARPFRCELCDAAFKRHSDFKSHALVHSEERPHTCEAWAKGFKRASNLQMLSYWVTSDSGAEPRWTAAASLSCSCLSPHLLLLPSSPFCYSPRMRRPFPPQAAGAPLPPFSRSLLLSSFPLLSFIHMKVLLLTNMPPSLPTLQNLHFIQTPPGALGMCFSVLPGGWAQLAPQCLAPLKRSPRLTLPAAHPLAAQAAPRSPPPRQAPTSWGLPFIPAPREWFFTCGGRSTAPSISEAEYNFPVL
ncbi:uncharacterized protein LOC141564666 isoform X4 [Sminthopsis crassicaudata]|uniref:uncharacterized protein LOC141564666 isoform X4 n=1 Tax=Sminthopsis crassicaudata TaxID=9301 RepID=UPI003D696D66